MTFTFGIRVDNIGPVKNLRFNENFGTNKTVIFAKNGSGKSFLSQAFQQIASNSLENNDNLISFGKSNANLKFQIDHYEAEVKLTRGNPTTIKNNHYIFHVFNSNYVRENIESRSFCPLEKDKMTGYILGKDKIDLSKEKTELEIKNTNLQSLKSKIVDEIKTKVDTYKTEFNLSRLGSFKSLISIDIDTFSEVTPKDVSSDMGKLKDDYKKVKSFPEDVLDLKIVDNVISQIKFEEIAAQLNEPVIKIKFDSNLEKHLSQNRSFIEEGMRIKKDKCPFCQQNIEREALELIEKYGQYLKSTESSVIKFCEASIKSCDNEISTLKSKQMECLKVKSDFNSLKEKLVDYQDEISIPQNFDMLKTNLETIRNKIADKIKDVSLPIDINDLLNNYNTNSRLLSEEFNSMNTEILNINKEKNSIANKQKEIKNSIIECLKDELYQNATIQSYLELKKEIFSIGKSIEEKEAKVKIEKEKKVLSTLKYFLNFFFRDKYTLSDDFIIKLGIIDITGKLQHVLSDGEKTIIAFCHFLAETHLLISTEDDYNKLFFIIDDPISSLDSNYVYSTVQVIRWLKDHFNLNCEKYLIFTHSVEFASILHRNNVCSNFLEIHNGDLKKINNERFRIPYISHLSDVNAISKGEAIPSHTTPNSLRQVIEGIKSFLAPSKGLEKFILDEPKLKGSSLFAIINDGSHGDIFSGENYSNTELKQIATDVIDYIKDSIFSEQLTGL